MSNHSNSVSVFACQFILVLTLCFSTAFAGSPPRRALQQGRRGDRAHAIATYHRAVRMRTALESRPENARPRVEYEKLIRTFQAVYHADPAYRKTPAALAAVGELYEEMGRQFTSDRYYAASLQAYQFLISQYPQNRLSRDALLTIGEIYCSDLENPEAARKVFQDFLEQYPESEKASTARDKLKQIDQLLAKRGASRRSAAENQPTDGCPEVTSIRRWVGPDYTRIVIGVEEEAKFVAGRLRNPERLVFDLSNTRLSPALVGKTFPVEDGFLRQIRIAQYRPTVTRVVLDVEKIEDYSVFSLPNPFRLVIDIHGTARAVAERPSTTKSLTPTSPAEARVQHDAPLQAPSRAPEAAASGFTSATATRPSAVAAEAESDSASEAGGRGTNRTTEASQPQRPESAAKEMAPVNAPSLRSSHALGPPPAVQARRGIAWPIQPAAPTEAGSRTLTRALGLKIARIVIDPGHGGHDTGTIGPTGLREKDLILDVALRLKQLLERNTGSEVVMTRSDDTFIPLEERTAIANTKGADLFISVHANASRDQSARGIETYYLNFTSNPEALEVAARENATSQEGVHQLQDLIKKIALTEKIQESHEFAKQVQREVCARLVIAGGGQENRGVKKAPFVVLIGANMPSILAEISFLTNPRDERLLKRADYRQKIAVALYRGIARYVNNLGGERVAQQVSAQQSSSAKPLSF